MDQTFLPTEKQQPDRLLSQRDKILTLPADEALTTILEDQQPAALTQAFSEEDFYFLVNDIGIEDALPLLRLSSDSQREFILDMEGWERDQPALPRMVRWLDVLFQTDPDRLTNWLTREQPELLELLLFRNIQVMLREHDQDPSVFGDDFFTLDDVYYVRITEPPALPEEADAEEDVPEKPDADRRRAFLYGLLTKIADEDHQLYQKILLEAAAVMPAEMEEELYRLRSVRLAEKGFQSFEQAMGIYQPEFPKAVETSRGNAATVSAVGGPAPALSPLKMLHTAGVFSEAVDTIDDTDLRQRIQLEFVSLCNRIISADQKPVRTRAHLQVVVEKACAFLSIGLEASFDNRPLDDPGNRAAMAAAIRRLPLEHLFRIGYGQALSLKWQADTWRKNAWFEKSGRPLTFWGEQWLGVLGGLLLEKPLFYDNYQTGATLYREFSCFQDIAATQAVLSDIMAWDRLLSAMSLPDCRSGDRAVTWQSLCLTLWARAYLEKKRSSSFDSGGRLRPITLGEFKTVFSALFAETADSSGSRKTGSDIKTRFLMWLSERSGSTPELLTETFGRSLDDLFAQVDIELGALSPDSLDPRFIYLFKVRR